MNPKLWRQRKGLTLREAARLLGCGSASTVQRYERGEREPPLDVVDQYRKHSGGAVCARDLKVPRKKKTPVALRTT